jgi:hypothetical protein
LDVCQRRPNSLYQAAAANRLFKQLPNAQAASALPGAGIKPSGNQYRWELYTPLSQIVDDVETAGTGHVLVDQQTACLAMPIISKEFASGTVGPHVEAKGFEQCLQRVGDHLIVIHNTNRLLNFARPRALAGEGHADLLLRMPLKAGFCGNEH